jgi:hypothetical protein
MFPCYYLSTYLIIQCTFINTLFDFTSLKIPKISINSHINQYSIECRENIFYILSELFYFVNYVKQE